MTGAQTGPDNWAPAKVNLFLHVGPVKSNGRHDLDSLVAFAGHRAADHLHVTAAEGLSLEVTGPAAADAGTGDDNLVLRAARALQAASGYTRGARITLDKRLPVAAGIGGGSSDAAATLRLLTKLWGVSPAHAQEVAPTLGGDVPVALLGSAAWMRGEGERVQPAQFPGPLPALLVNPGLACPTGEVFGAFDSAGGGRAFAEIDPAPEFSDTSELICWLAAQRNDLEAPAIRRLPEIANVLDFLCAQPGVRLARMSGSGATCFALFDDLAAAERAELLVRQDVGQRHWWSAACQLGHPE